MKSPERWDPFFRLNTCTICGHYLHDKECVACTANGENCPEGVGKFAVEVSPEFRFPQ